MRVSVGLTGIVATALVIGSSVALGFPGAWAAAADGSQTLYVDSASGCSDTGPGTEATPFCTLQAAANAAAPGDTVAIESTVFGPVTITTSGVTFTGAGTGMEDIGTDDYRATGHPVITLDDVTDVTISHLTVSHADGDDGIDVDGSSGITLDSLAVDHVVSSQVAPQAVGVSIDGGSSDVTVSRTAVYGRPDEDAILVQPGARQVTVTTNIVHTSAGPGIVIDDTAGAVVTSNTVLAFCNDASGTANAVTLEGGTTARVENNVLNATPVVGASSCPAPGAAISVDAASAAGVSASYDAFYASGGASDYSWTGAAYGAGAVPGQGAHDIALPVAGENATEGSPIIDSADCFAPGELGTDLAGHPHVDDPLVPNTGTGTCYADRGAIEQQDAIPFITNVFSPSTKGIPVGAVPFTSTLALSPATSNWGAPLSYTVDFGDGSAPVTPTLAGGRFVASHRYTATGTHQIQIAATDAAGLTQSAILGVDALAAQPTPGTLSATPDREYAGGPVTPDAADFSATVNGYWPGGQMTVSYGDGTPAAAPVSHYPSITAGESGLFEWSHTYAKPGTYTATLAVTDLLGRVTTTRQSITVGDQVTIGNTRRDYAKTIPAHALVKIPLSTLTSKGVYRGAFVNVIVTSPRQSGSVIMYPDGTSRPDLATVQFRAGQSAANTALATGGSTIDFYNSSAGQISLEIDTDASEAAADPQTLSFDWGSAYVPVTPQRVLAPAKVAGNHQVAFTVAGSHGVPGNATAVVLDITATGPGAAGHLETWAEKDQASTQQADAFWAKGQQVTTQATVPVNGAVAMKNASTATTSLTASVVGYYTAPTGDSGIFLPARPSRLLEVTLAAGHTARLAIAGKDGVPATGTTAAMVNLTATHATANGTITAWADGTTRPGGFASLSYAKGTTVATAAIVGVGKDGAIDLYNYGTKPALVVLDLTGSYYAY
jgi:hypothetical protein